jgi:cellulose synthase/poly-beta-1,6-N-acetylglucosamine synthase-like glycosyltransferase
LILTSFFIGLAWLTYVYVGYPVVLFAIAFWKRIYPQISTEYRPSVSVLIAARNEEQDIGWKIEETLNWDYPSDRLEILVGSDASDDATDEIVQLYAGRGVKLVRMSRRGGKARALNELAQLAGGKVLFFTDANAHIQPHTLRLMVRHLVDPRVGCVTGDSRSIEEATSAALSRGANVYWGYESFLRHLENSIGSVLVCDGAIFCIRASLFEQLCPDLANDLESPMRIGALGHWIIHESRALVFEYETNSALEEFRRRRRICAQGMLAMFRLPETLSGLRGWQFVSHKCLRWLSLLPLMTLLAASISLASRSLPFRLLLGLQGLFYALAIIGFVITVARRSVPRLFAVPFYIILGLFGALVGVVEALLGKRFDIWEIPVYSRGEISARFNLPPKE